MITFNSFNSTQMSMLRYLDKAQNDIDHYSSILANNNANYSPRVNSANSAMISRIDGEVVGIIADIDQSLGSINILETADNSFAQVESILTRMKELAEDATDASLTSGERTELDNEYQSLIAEINALPAQAKYNGKSVFTPANFNFTALGFTIPTFSDIDDTGAPLSASDLTDVGNATTAVGLLDTALAEMANKRTNVGGNINVQNFKLDNLQTQQANLESAQASLMSYDDVEVTSKLTAAQVQSEIITALVAQANITQQNAVALLFQGLVN